MRQIIKGEEPKDLLKYRKQQGAYYDNMPISVKNNLRQTLLRSQGYLCCYCMQRISQEESKIEHFKSQKHHNGKDGSEDLTLSFSNLFIACPDKSGYSLENQTCDSHKGDLELKKINLSSPLCNTMFIYNANGKISSTDQDADIEDDITTLNLNQQTLKENRKTIYISLIERFQTYSKKGLYNKKFLERELSHWQEFDKNGMLKEYCMVAIYLIKKHLMKFA